MSSGKARRYIGATKKRIISPFPSLQNKKSQVLIIGPDGKKQEKK